MPADKLENFRLNHNDVVFARTGATTGKSFLVKKPPSSVFASYLIRLQLKSAEILPEFLILYFQTPDYWNTVQEGTAGSAQGGFNATKLAELVIPTPPIIEQKRIVSILDEAFEGIATAKANAEQNLRNSLELFDSYLDRVFSMRSGFNTVSIGSVGKVYDGPHATPKTIDDGPIFLGISALKDGQINLKETRHVSPEDFIKWTRRVKPQANDFVFSYETRLGQAAIIPENFECCLGRRMGLVRFDPRKVNPLYFVYQYVSPPFRAFLETKIVRGATVDRISIKDFPSFPILVPSLSEQERIADEIGSFRNESQRLETIYRQKIAALDELKKALLHKAFAGEL